MPVFKTLVARKLTGWLTSNTRPPGSEEPQQHFLVNPARTLCGPGKHTEVLQPGAARPSEHAGLKRQPEAAPDRHNVVLLTRDVT